MILVQDLSFNGLELLAVELILRLVLQLTDNGASYEIRLISARVVTKAELVLQIS